MNTPRPLFVATLVVASLATACGAEAPPPPKPAAPPPVASTTAAPVAPAEPAKPAEPPPPPAPTPVATWKDMATPESVLYDEAADRYLVSNIQGKPLDADGNGFISELSPDGKVTKLKWIEGSAKVKLDAPKGMALVKGTLYVADIDTVRMFDAKSGAPKGALKIEGATFLNDVSSAPDGRVFVTDSGLKAGAADFEPTGTDAVYVIEKGKAKPLAKSAELGRPNGVLFTDKGVLVNTFGAAELFRLGDKGEKLDATKTPNGGLDGLVAAGDTLLVSSWGGSAVYRGKLGGTFVPVLESLKAPADIGWDSKRSRVLVPRFLGDVVEAYEIK